MVPMCSITSALLIPIPLSAIVIVAASMSIQTRICSGPSSSGFSPLDSSSSRSRSIASDAFEISSRRKISLLLYSELIIKSRSCTTSAWKPNVSWSCTVIGFSRTVSPLPAA